MEGKKSTIVIKNLNDDNTGKTASGVLKIIPDGTHLSSEDSSYEGYTAYNGGTGGAGYPIPDAKGLMGSELGHFNDIVVARPRGGRYETSVIEKSAAGQTELEVPRTQAQEIDEPLDGRPVISETVDKSTQHAVVGGLSGTDPSKGLPRQVYTEDVLLYPMGPALDYTNCLEAKPKTEMVFESRMRKETGPVAVTGKDGFSKGRTNLTHGSEGNYFFSGVKLKFYKDGTWDGEVQGRTKLKTNASPHLELQIDNPRARFHNRIMAEIDYINDQSSDVRDNDNYCSFNSTSPLSKRNEFAYFWYRVFNYETANHIYAAWESSILANSFMRYRLNLDGQREKTFITENFLNRSFARSSADSFPHSECSSVDDIFSSDKWAMGSAFNIMSLHESEKKATDKHGKVASMVLEKNHLQPFTTQGAIETFSGLRMNGDFAGAYKEARYYTIEEPEAKNRLYVTDALGMTFPYDISREFIGNKRRVDPTPMVDGTTGSFNQFEFSNDNTVPFVSVMCVSQTYTNQMVLVYNPMFQALRQYLDNYAPAWYAKLSHGKGVSSNQDHYEIYVPFTFTVTQPSMWGSLLAESMTELDNYRTELFDLLGNFIQAGDHAKAFPFELKDITYQCDDVGGTIELKRDVSLPELIENPSRHYTRAENTKKVLFGGITPGVFDTHGADFLHWFSRDTFTKTGSFRVTDTAGLNDSAIFSIIEGPNYVSTVDYAYDTSRMRSKVKTFNDAFPMLMATYHVALRGLSRINIPVHSTLNAFNDTDKLFGITNRTFFHQNRILNPFSDYNPESGVDEYRGVPIGDAKNPLVTGRGSLIVAKTFTGSSNFTNKDNYVGMWESNFSLEWYLCRCRNNGYINPLPVSPWYNDAKPGVDGNKIVSVNNNGTITLRLPSMDTSILNRTGITIYSWRKDVTPDQAGQYTRHQENSNLSYRKGMWDRFDMFRDSETIAEGRAWNVPLCMSSSMNLQQFCMVTTGLNAWASGDVKFKGEFNTPYSANTFEVKDSKRRLYTSLQDLITPVDGSSGQVDNNPGMSVDWASYVYGKTWMFRDPLCMFDRLVSHSDATGVVFAPSNHNAWMEMNGFGGWVAYDYSGTSEALSKSKDQYGKRYINRVTESGVISTLAVTKEEVEAVAEADKAADEATETQ